MFFEPIHSPLRALITIFASSCILYGSEPSFSLSEQVKNAIPSIVRIKVQKSESSDEENELITIDSGGSGFVYGSGRHILTNSHVIGDGKKIAIIDHNNIEYPAKLIAKDDQTDIAVLSADSFEAPSLSVENNSTVNSGDGVFVIGAPYSLDYSVSAGVISATKRFLPNYPYLYFIQTDAAINPGNSGGPVFNYQGRLIGMASTHFTRQGGYTNIGFAIPIVEIDRIATQLIGNQKIIRGYLGAVLLISENMSRKMGYQSSVLVTSVAKEGPAERAGLKGGDLIVAVNGERFNDAGALHRFLEHSQPKGRVTLTYLRNKQLTTAEITLQTPYNWKKETTNAGTGDQAEKLGITLIENDDGVEVAAVREVGKTIGLTRGDRILRMNDMAVKTIKEFNSNLEKLQENEIGWLNIKRQSDTVTLPIGTKKALKGYATKN